jgi:uncharacterized protein (TIGR03437 family)
MSSSLSAFHRTFLLALITGSAAFLAAQTTCPALNLLTTPRIVAADKQVVFTMRQSDGSFTGYYGPRVAPFLYSSATNNFQDVITSCYPVTTKKGSAAFTSYNRAGFASYLADQADLDGDGVPDAVMISYKPNLVQVILMAPSDVPKSGSPSPVTVGAPPISVRAVDVNKDGKPDLIISAGDNPNGSPPGSIYVLLNTGNGSFGANTRYPAGAEPQGFAVVDVNGDGIPDLVVADQGNADGSGTGVAVLFGNGTGGFSSASNFPTSAPATSVVVGDFNGDGKLDIAAATGSLITVFPGNGNGTFGSRVTFPSGGDSMYLAMGDFNGDGKLDLVVSNYNEQTASVLLNNGSGSAISFQAPVGYVISRGRSTEFLVVTDFNNDGIPDIVGGTGTPTTIAGNSNNALDVLLGNGDGTFAAPPVVPVGNNSPIAFAVAGDFNGDGKMDVAAMPQNSTNLMFYAGHGDGTFAAPVTTALGENFINAIGAIPGDFNGDGLADLAIVTTAGFAIALSQKNGSFQPLNTTYHSLLSASGLAVGDFNGDGKLDVATPVCNSIGGTSAVHVYLGNGAGGFADSQPFNLNYCPDEFLASDLNGDKKPDLISLNNAIPAAGAYSSADIMLNLGQGAFAGPKTYGLDPNGRVRLTLFDVNGDGAPDLVAAAAFSKPYEITAVLNNGDGTFGSHATTVLTSPPWVIAGADLNGDKKGDLIIEPSQGGPTAAANDLNFAVGNGDGTFQSPVHLAAPNTGNFLFADFNGDGRPDLLVTSSPFAPFGYFMVILTGAPPTAPPPSLSAVNGASFAPGASIAAESIASAFGSHLAVSGNPGGTAVIVQDAAGANRQATIFFASPGQVNFQVPPGTANGPATVTVTAGDGTVTSGMVQVVNVAPGMFAANSGGLYAGSVLVVGANGTQTPENNYQLDANQNVIPLPVSLSPATNQVFLIMYGTGIRHAASVTATVGGQKVPVAFAGAQGTFVGEDQVNIGPLPPSLAGSGKANIVITADGQAANTVNLTIQ